MKLGQQKGRGAFRGQLTPLGWDGEAMCVAQGPTSQIWRAPDSPPWPLRAGVGAPAKGRL